MGEGGLQLLLLAIPFYPSVHVSIYTCKRLCCNQRAFPICVTFRKLPKEEPSGPPRLSAG